MKNSQIMHGTILDLCRGKWRERTMYFPFHLLVFLILPILSQSQVYVNAAATGTPNGTSWTNAYRILNAALAANANTSPLTVLVAAGTYNEPNAGVSVNGAIVNISGGYNVTTGIANPKATPSILNYNALTITANNPGMNYAGDTAAITYKGTGGSFNLYGLTIKNISNTTFGHADGNGTGFFKNQFATTSSFSFKNLTITDNLKPYSIFLFSPLYNITNGAVNCYTTGPVTFDSLYATNNVMRQGIFKYFGSGLMTIKNSSICSNNSTGVVDNAPFIFAGCGGMNVDNIVMTNNICTTPTAGANSGGFELASYGSTSPVVITNSLFTCNKSVNGFGEAGVIAPTWYCTNPLIVDNCKFYNNQTNGASVPQSSAGAIYIASGQLGSSITNCIFKGNTGAIYGAGAINSAAPITVNNSVFSNNTSASAGGAIKLVNEDSSVILNSTFVNNTAPTGGAIYTQQLKDTSKLTITNCKFTGNSATGSVAWVPPGAGGAIYYIGVTGSNMSVKSSAFANNTGNAIVTVNGSLTASSYTIDSSQFSGNTVATGGSTLADVWNAANTNGGRCSATITNSSLQGATIAGYTANQSTVNSSNLINNTGTTASTAPALATFTCATSCPTITCVSAPTLIGASISNICPATTVNLNNALYTQASNIVWYTNNTHTGTKYATPSAAVAGTYYAFYFDSAANCYSPASDSLIAATISCTPPTASSCPNVEYITNGSFENHINKCVNFTVGTIPTNNVYGWYDGTAADPTFMMYDSVNNCIFNKPASNYPTASAINAGHTGQAWMGLARSSQSDAHILVNTLQYTLAPGTHTMTFWAAVLPQIQPFFGGVVSTGPATLKVQGFAPNQPLYFYDGPSTGQLIGTSPQITNYITTSNQTWVQYSMTITNTVSVNKIAISFGDNAYVYLDDVSILDVNPNCCNSTNLTGMYCDFDKDSVSNAKDLDDDNDGLQDAVENPACYYTASEFSGNGSSYATTVKMPVITEMEMRGSLSNMENAFNGLNPYVANQLPPSGSGWAFLSQDWINKTILQWQYNAAIPVTQFTIYQMNYPGYVFGTNGSTIKLQGSTNGTNWVDVSVPTSAYVDVAFNLTNTLQSGVSFNYYRIRGVSGSSLQGNKAIVEVVPTINASAYNPSTNPKTSCVALDTDKDGLANQFDLDADGDGCPDAIEGGAMLNVNTLVNSTLAGGNTGSIYNGTYALPVVQNLGNTVGMTPTTMGIPTVATTGQTLGTSADKTQKNAQCYLLAFNTDPDQNVGVVNKPISGNLSTNDDAPAGTTYSNPVAQTGNPATTLPTVNPNGTYTFTATIPGEYKFLVTVCPNGLTTNCPTEQLFINVLNAAPIANVDLSTTKANTPDTINVKSNDLAGNPNGTLGTPSIVTSPLHGTATIDPTGKIIYVPATNYTGADTIYYKICETPSNLCDTTVVYVDVIPSVPPTVDNTIVDDNKSTLQNSPLTIPVSQGVLANDQTTGTSPLLATAQTKTIAGKGTLILNPNGSYTFTPALDFVGSVDFPYEACSGTTCDSATVHIVITPFESTPDMNAGLINKPILGNVKTNDIVPTGTTYSNPVAQPSNPSTSTPTVNPDGTYTFTTTVPGEYKFNVSVCPPNVTTNCPTEELTISVLDVNNKPIAAQDFGTTKVNVKDTINILTNDMSGNLGGTLGTPAIVTNPKNGTASIDPTTGKLIYTPTTNFVGKDTVYYKVCEVQNGKCDTTSVIITVDSTPTIIVVATDDNKTTFMNTPVTVSANNGVLTNDESTGTSPLTTIAQTTTIPNKGTLVMNTDGSYTFTPAATFSGSVDFPYTACGSTICDNATLHIVITPMDPAPDQNSGLVNKTILGNLSTNDDMPLNSTYSAPVAQSGNPTSSLPALNPDGTYAFVGTTPGEYNFLVSVCPPTMTVNCPKELLTIHVIDNASPSNKPAAKIDNSTTKLNTPDTLNILANDMAGNIGGTLTTPSIVSAPKNGTASIDPTTGKLIYTPNTSFAGIDTVVYKVCETPSGKCDSTLAIITVNPAFDSLSIAAIDDNNVTFQNTPLMVSAANGVLNNDKYTGVGTKMVTPQTTTIANKGTLTLNADGSYTFTPVATFTGSVDFPYTVCVATLCDKATLHILVDPKKTDTLTKTPVCATCPVTFCTTSDDLPKSTATFSTCSTPAGYTKTGPDANGCYTYTPNGTVTSPMTTCQVSCIGSVCDTTIIVIKKPITADTVTTTPSCPTCPVTVCTTGDDIANKTGATYSTCSTPAGYTKSGPDANGCYIYTPNGTVTSDKTTCQVICNNGVCDTTYVTLKTPTALPPTKDTVVTPAPACPTCPVTACTVGDDIPSGGTPTYSTCSTPAGYTKTGPDANGCYTYTPTGATTTGLVQTCQVKCVGTICDTTIVIIPTPIKPDTVTTTPSCPTCPVTVCTTGNDVPAGGTPTYSTCSTPAGYTKTGPDANGCYIYTPNGSVTSSVTTCQVKCNLGVCDTTYVTLKTPTALPPTKDTVVTPAPACPTCPVTACTIGDDIPAGGTPTYSTCSTPAGYTKTGPDANGCYTYTPTGATTTGLVQTCQVKCVGTICDTTIVIIPTPIKPDTVTTTPSCPTCPVTVCTTGNDVPAGGTPTYSTCSTPAGYTKTGPDANGCYIYTPNGSVTSPVTTCQVKCNLGVCDTTYVTINKPTPIPATLDTVVTPAPACPTCPVTACTVGDDIPAGGTPTYSTCSTPAGYTKTGPDANGCYTYTPTGATTTGLVQTCQVKCVGSICDTTIVIIPTPIKPDTVTTTPSCPTCPVTVCTSGNDVPAGTPTYSTCSTPAGYTKTGPDANGCYIYTPNGSVTSPMTTCQVKCVGTICDTTYVKINVPTSLPATPDTVVTPAPACPTCPVTACTVGDDIPAGGTPTYSTCSTPAGYTKTGPDANGCFTYTPTGTVTSPVTTCQVKCLGTICDTTYVVLPQPITPNRITVTPTCDTCPVTVCTVGDDLPLGAGTVSFNTCGVPSGYALVGNNNNGCYTYKPNGATAPSTTCQVACKSGVCDTTYVTINPFVAVPDLAIATEANPSTVITSSTINVIININEIKGVNTSGPIVVKLSKDDYKMPLTFDSTMTTVGFDNVNNSNWSYSSNLIYHIFTYKPSVMNANSNSKIGLVGTFYSRNSNGVFTITSFIVNGSGSEVNTSNNMDTNDIKYFK